MTDLGRSGRFLVEACLRGLLARGPVARLLELVAREEVPEAWAPDGRGVVPVPDLPYRLAVPAGEPVAAAAPRNLSAWEAPWKPSPGEADGLGYESRAGFYLPRTPPDQKRPGILVLPLLHDRLALVSGMLARDLAARGFAVLELRSGRSFLDRVRVTPEGAGPTWEEAETEMIRDGRRGLDWLCARPEVDAGRLGIVGISHGAIVGSCVLGADPRLRAGVFFMGGADQAMMVGRSRGRSVRRFRRRFLRARGLSDPAALQRFSPGLAARTEPLAYAPAVDTRSVLLFKTRLDRAVVPAAQDKLWEAMGRPRRVSLPFGHIGFILVFYYAARRAAEFLRDRLATPA